MCVFLRVKVGGGDGVEIARTHVTVSSSQLRASVRGAGTADKMRGGETDPNTRRPPEGAKLGAPLTQECGEGCVT